MKLKKKKKNMRIAFWRKDNPVYVPPDKPVSLAELVAAVEAVK